MIIVRKILMLQILNTQRKSLNRTDMLCLRWCFWNVASRNMQSPVEMNEQGVTLVSGCNPRIFSMVTEDKCTPYEYMLDVLNQERYADIKA